MHSEPGQGLHDSLHWLCSGHAADSFPHPIGALLHAILQSKLVVDVLSTCPGSRLSSIDRRAAVTGDVHGAVLHLLAARDIRAAIEIYSSAGLHREAAALATAKLLPGDPTAVAAQAAHGKALHNCGNFEASAAQHLAGELRSMPADKTMESLQLANSCSMTRLCRMCCMFSIAQLLQAAFAFVCLPLSLTKTWQCACPEP